MRDRKSTRLNSSHTEIYTLSLHDALPIYLNKTNSNAAARVTRTKTTVVGGNSRNATLPKKNDARSEEHTSELQSHRDLHSFPTRRSSDLFEQNKQQCRGQGDPHEDDCRGRQLPQRHTAEEERC